MKKKKKKKKIMIIISSSGSSSNSKRERAKIRREENSLTNSDNKFFKSHAYIDLSPTHTTFCLRHPSFLCLRFLTADVKEAGEEVCDKQVHQPHQQRDG